MAFIASPILPLSAIIALYKYPEWWVVNGVGMIVGSGVIVMIGISFVPVLICTFMIAAAIYDYWAVHCSKHMLELADTMIDLKLPVVLLLPRTPITASRSEQGSMQTQHQLLRVLQFSRMMEEHRRRGGMRFSWAWVMRSSQACLSSQA